MQKSKDYTGLSLLIPFGIALIANVFPYRSPDLNKDLVQPIVNAQPVSKEHACEYDLCPSKGHNHYVPCSDGRECNTIDSLHFVYPVLTYEQLELMIDPVQ